MPTLTQADFSSHRITDKKRYHALVSQLIKRRGSEFKIDINGDSPLKLKMEDITLDGANAMLFLLDPASRYICGSILFVDGGHDALLRPDQF